MVASTEVRWFFPGEPSAETWAWVRSGDLGALQSPRTDEYLVLPGRETTGIKLREGLFEVKATASAPAP